MTLLTSLTLANSFDVQVSVPELEGGGYGLLITCGPRQNFRPLISGNGPYATRELAIETARAQYLEAIRGHQDTDLKEHEVPRIIEALERDGVASLWEIFAAELPEYA